MDYFIDLSTAAQMTRRYRENREAILQPLYQEQNILPICETFDRAAFAQLLGQSGCAGIRIYYGMDEDYLVHAVVVGVDADGADMLPGSATAASETAGDTEEEDVILENANRCPPICPPESALNT